MNEKMGCRMLFIWEKGCSFLSSKSIKAEDRNKSFAFDNRKDVNVFFDEASLHIIASNFDQSIAIIDGFNAFIGTGMMAMTICQY